jgi:hypothetical protein
MDLSLIGMVNANKYTINSGLSEQMISERHQFGGIEINMTLIT